MAIRGLANARSWRKFSMLLLLDLFFLSVGSTIAAVDDDIITDPAMLINGTGVKAENNGESSPSTTVGTPDQTEQTAQPDQEALVNGEKEFYTGTAIDFLIQYGQHYHLFDTFFGFPSTATDSENDDIGRGNSTSSSGSSSSSSSSSGEEQQQKKQPRGRVVQHIHRQTEAERAVRDLQPLSEDISARYRVRNYSNYRTWNVASAKYNNISFDFTEMEENTDGGWKMEISEEMKLINDKFRYGPGAFERFLSIDLKRDPWTTDNAQVQFVGWSTNFKNEEAIFFCKFSYYMRPGEVSVVQGTIVDKIKNVLGMRIGYNVIYCDIPEDIRRDLALYSAFQRTQLGLKEDTSREKEWESENEEVIEEVRLDVSIVNTTISAIEIASIQHQQQHHEQQQQQQGEERSLLIDVRVPRTKALDRRSFRVVIANMVDNFEDPMVTEWLTYNILLGVEHFYLYDNTKRDISLWNSQLRPFLDANIVTVIFYPFVADQFGRVQMPSANSFLNRFGPYTEWSGCLIDVDEFFTPSENFIESFVPREFRPEAASLLVSTLFSLSPYFEPGLMFDTVEMGCIDKQNYYRGGNNEHLDAALPIDERNMTAKDMLLLAEAETQKALAFLHTHRPAVSTFCTKRGMQFRELDVGHGKMFIRPAKKLWLVSPHRMNDYDVQWTTPGDGGLMRHFDRLRYSYGFERERKSKGWSSAYMQEDNTVRDLTFMLLKARVGIRWENMEAGGDGVPPGP